MALTRKFRAFFFALNAINFEGDRSWSPLCSFTQSPFFHLCDFGFYGFDQLCELFLAFLSCLGVDILGYAFAVDSRREPPFIEMVVYHRHSTGSALSYLWLVRLKKRFCGVFLARLVTCLGRCRFGHFCVCTADLSVDVNRRLLLHLLSIAILHSSHHKSLCMLFCSHLSALLLIDNGSEIKPYLGRLRRQIETFGFMVKYVCTDAFDSPR